MADDPTMLSLAATRSHEDAKAVNALFQAAGQVSVLINGGAATATLTFSTADKAPLRLTNTSLGIALASFALGVFFGASVFLAQGASAQRYVVYWEGQVRKYEAEVIERARVIGGRWGMATRVAFTLSMTMFIVGAAALAISLFSGPSNCVLLAQQGSTGGVSACAGD